MMFFWASAARRPLSLLEMREIIAIHDGQKHLSQSVFLPNVNNMVPWCAGLLELDEEERVVRFTHQTVREYLFQACEEKRLSCFHNRPERMDWDAGKACVTYLSLEDFVAPPKVEGGKEEKARSKSLPQPQPRSLSGGVGTEEGVEEVNGEVKKGGKKGMGGALARSRSTLEK